MRFVAAIATMLVVGGVAGAEPTTAEQWFVEGNRAYDRNDFTGAVEAWKQSYAASKEPELLFDIGQAYRQLYDCPHALAAYQQFLALDSTSDRRARAEGFVRELGSACSPADDRAPPPPPPAVKSTTPPAPKYARVDMHRTQRAVGLAVAGLGVAIAGAGAYFHYWERQVAREQHDLAASCSPDQLCSGPVLGALDDRARRRETMAITGYSAGGAAIVTGVVLYVLGRRTDEVLIAPTAGGAVVTTSLAF